MEPRDQAAGHEDKVFLSFSLGPVQTFIASARTVRDLWTGSYLLAWLTFQAMRPILDEFGEEAMVFPRVNGHPLWRFYRHREFDARRKLPCIPNRFLAELPLRAEQAGVVAAKCETACRTAWTEICAAVERDLRKLLDTELPAWAASWDATRWSDQIQSFFEVCSVVLPWEECAAALLESLSGERVSRDRDQLWTARWRVLGGLLDAQRAVRHVPDYRGRGDVPQKCSLLGSYEQMGPAQLEASRSFWEAFSAEGIGLRGTRIRAHERLCAVSLVKRFAWPAYFATADGLQCDVRELHYQDTATTAAKLWLKNAQAIEECQALDPEAVRDKHKDWSGQWLHWRRPDQGRKRGEGKMPDAVWRAVEAARKQLGPAPTYYAILMLDGDHMGQLLRGGPDRAGRARHACISELLASFALDRVPRTVEEQEGELIVAGGDDVLALLPAATALTCAQSLAGEFEALPWATEAGLLGPGRTPPTVSAGLAVVHYKEDLRFALGCARRAEKTAKGAGRNAFAITVCRRSGEHSLAICDWPFVKSLTRWASGFQKASDRWAYQLAGELPTLRGLPADAMKAELRRVLGRAEKDTRDIFPAESLVCELEACCRFALAPGRRPKDAGFLARHPTRELQDEELLGRALSNFVTLCQTASFLARGRDE